ncbi:2-(acetamidomethylene)succinate hydrolase [Candidatus Phycosocius bacilliformis]|uniref:2-(Acetamidomethylene)succinate hydrolase n=1 Tax=Candidatus Phycosocius bacilliformis TaxID=1445552 RepID=A0A2P2EB37_9PROT|nr:alpha/beta hydrolase [Candidatus Phycosocius bacilliformis]GBF58288.1 2-(acetamidomethylene)succinate hydrolase [Candidatus Phycosocius bacilliformis]
MSHELLAKIAPYLVLLAALCLFMALSIMLRLALIQRSWPPIGRFVTARGVKAHVIEHGSGPEVLMVHGAASNARELISALGHKLDGLRLIAPDRPGLGYSERPPKAQNLGEQAAFLADILRQSASGPVVAVGHSWGAGVILRLALDHPELVKALVLLAPASHPWKQTRNWLNSLAVIPVLGDILAWTLPPLLGPKLAPKGIARGFAPGPVEPADYGERIGTPLYFRPKSYQANAADMVVGSAQMAAQAGRYRSLKLPVSIVSGQGDIIVFNSIHAAGLARDLPHAQSYRVAMAGHMPHWVDPDLVVEIIRAYATDRVPAPTSSEFRAEA